MLHHAGLKTVAFVDDASIVIRDRETAQEAMNVARSTLFRMGLDVHNKTKLIAFATPHSPSPPIISITTPKQHPVPSRWLLVDTESPPNTLCHTTTQITHPDGTIEITSENSNIFQHLGHLISTDMNPSTAFKGLVAEAKELLTNLHNQPLTYRSRIQTFN